MSTHLQNTTMFKLSGADNLREHFGIAQLLHKLLDEAGRTIVSVSHHTTGRVRRSSNQHIASDWHDLNEAGIVTDMEIDLSQDGIALIIFRVIKDDLEEVEGEDESPDSE